MSKNDGGNAFPFFDERAMNSAELGMSLRDYFAAKAMATVMAENFRLGQGFGANHSFIAHVAYSMADAMLSERAK